MNYYDDYEDEYFDDYTDQPLADGPTISIYNLPILAVIIISAILILVWNMIDFPEAVSVPAENKKPAESNLQLNIAPLFTPEVQFWSDQIFEWAKPWGLDPNLVATVMQIESCGFTEARSSAGALGLFQVMPFHFNEKDNPYHPEINAKRGLAYLALSLDNKNGNIRLGLAGYNAGITGASRPEASWPAETIRYTKWGLGIYEDARAGKSESNTLNEWLNSGGASLCQKAAEHLGLNK